jgi:hypothetical protein
MPPKRKKSGGSSATKQRGVSARCNLLLKYLHPQVLVSSKIPKDGWTHKQELTGFQPMPHICGTKKGYVILRGIFYSKIGPREFY